MLVRALLTSFSFPCSGTTLQSSIHDTQLSTDTRALQAEGSAAQRGHEQSSRRQSSAAPQSGSVSCSDMGSDFLMAVT